MLVYQVFLSAVVPFFFLFGFYVFHALILEFIQSPGRHLGFSPTFFMFGLAAAPSAIHLSVAGSRGPAVALIQFMAKFNLDFCNHLVVARCFSLHFSSLPIRHLIGAPLDFIKCIRWLATIRRISRMHPQPDHGLALTPVDDDAL